MSTSKMWNFSNASEEWKRATQGSLKNAKNTSLSVWANVCNNPDRDLIGEATAKQVSGLLYMTVLALTELFGLTTNTINCVVFVRQGLRDRINLCLFSLALADISFLGVLFAAKFHTFLGLFDKDFENYWEKKSKEILLGPMLATLTISNLMTMIISVERCVCVMTPFTAKKYLKTRYMAVIIVFMAAYLMGFFSLQSTPYVTVRVTDPVTNASRWTLQLSDFFLENRQLLNTLSIQLFVIPYLSLAVVIITASITISRLRQTFAWRQQSVNTEASAGEKREAALTKMLTVVCVIYVTTIAPSVIQSTCLILVPGYTARGRYCNTFLVIQTLAHLCEVTNSSVNFIVYFTMGSRFRETLRQLCGTWQDPKQSGVSD